MPSPQIDAVNETMEANRGIVCIKLNVGPTAADHISCKCGTPYNSYFVRLHHAGFAEFNTCNKHLLNEIHENFPSKIWIKLIRPLKNLLYGNLSAYNTQKSYLIKIGIRGSKMPLNYNIFMQTFFIKYGST